MADPHSILKKVFGYDSFRPGQEEIVRRLLDGQDVLAVMPTGAGKSICYQVPALLLPGITIVVSPLVSLMKDQVGALVQAGVAAAFLNNSLTDNQKARHLQPLRGDIDDLIRQISIIFAISRGINTSISTSNVTRRGAMMDCFLYSRTDCKSFLFIFFTYLLMF